MSLPETVLPDDRVTHAEALAYFSELCKLENAIAAKEEADAQSGIVVEIRGIFEKILTWKQTAGELNAQEDMVHKALKPKRKIKIHNVKTVEYKLKELQPAIGLTDEEIWIIIFTSLDHDYLTNLILMQGEFLKWFTLNFEGESREELDFLDSKSAIWTATTTLGMEIVQRYRRLQENQAVILTDKWWSHLRFLHFGS